MSRQADPFETAYQVGTTLSASLDLDEVLASIARQVGEAMDVQWCDINEYDAGAGTMTYLAVWSEQLRREDTDYLGTVVSMAERPERDAVIRKGDILEAYLDDPGLDAREREVMEQYDERAVMEIPLVYGGEPIGVLGIVDARPDRRYDAADKQLFRLLAQPAAIAIGNARAHRAQRERARSTAALLDSSRVLAATLDLDEVLARVAQLAVEVSGASQSAIYEYHAETDTLVYKAEFMAESAPKGTSDQDVGAVYQMSECPNEQAVLAGAGAVEEHLSDPELDPLRRQVMEEFGEATSLTLPLRFGESPVGLLRLYELERERRFEPSEIDLLEALGEIASAAIHNACLFREERDQSGRLLGLFESTTGLASSFELGTIVTEIERGAARLFGDARAVDVWLHGDDGALAPSADVVAAAGAEAGSAPSPLPPPPGALAAQALAALAPAQAAGDDASELIVPFAVRGQAAGLVVVHGPGHRAFANAEVEALQVLANQVAVAVDNARLYRYVERQAIRDGLTGLFNHRYFQERLLQECALARRYDLPLSLLMIDVDDFKKFNDEFGHQLGDEVLREIGGVLAGSVRHGIDLPARYGGEEFAIILPHTRADGEPPEGQAPKDGAEALPPAGSGALVVAERLRLAIAERAFAGHGGRRYAHVTVTVGVARFSPDHQGAADLVRVADEALYAGKRGGRDRVEVRL
ncbi:MAG TPA: diguanylate cyclase [Thermoleophilia bacterium]|nr:diguanylate cyclase [Thermoleophilia bacterium]